MSSPVLSPLKTLRKHHSSSFFCTDLHCFFAHGGSWCSFLWHPCWAWEEGIPWEEAQEVVGLFFSWWLGSPLAVSWKCHHLAPHYTWLALDRGNHFLLGSCFKVHYHWGHWFGAHFGGVRLLPLFCYSCEHCSHSTHVDTIPQKACWFDKLQEARCGGVDLAW